MLRPHGGITVYTFDCDSVWLRETHYTLTAVSSTECQHNETIFSPESARSFSSLKTKTVTGKRTRMEKKAADRELGSGWYGSQTTEPHHHTGR